MRALVSAGLLGASVIALSGGASAQDPATQQALTEEYCVYEKLTTTTDYQIVAEAYLADDAEDAEMLAAVKKAVDDCAVEHGMNENQKGAASEVGIYGATADYLAEELLTAGISQEVVDSLLDVIDEMSDEDLDVLFEEDWRKNAAMSARLKAAVIAQGIPDRAGSIDMATQVVELSAFAMDSVISYALAAAGDEES